MEHRGACGCDPESGDGAGVLIHVPHKLFQSESLSFDLPEVGGYGVACVFIPKEVALDEVVKILHNCAEELDLSYLGSREVPVNSHILGEASKASEPNIYHLFFTSKNGHQGQKLDRDLLLFRKYANHEVIRTIPSCKDDFYIVSSSSRTLVYKGQLTSIQVRQYYQDLSNPNLESAIALVHSRFSTNTIPRWKLAQPFRMIAHNGEINTIEGNKNWWRAKEKTIESEYFTTEEFEKMFPLFNASSSDSAVFDNIVEFLVHNGRSLPHALMMMIPEAWQNFPSLEQYKRDFYEYHEALMEPWDGPASMCFTDGTLVGGTLDRNGLRPSRYCLTNDHRLILASETGVLPVDPAIVIKKGRLEPGKILIADLDLKKVIGDSELKEIICKRLPYGEWLASAKIDLNEIPAVSDRSKSDLTDIRTRQTAFGYTLEDEDLIIKGMVDNAKDPVGSMGADVPLAVLSKYTQHIATYFRQQFAQVTNPPIDSLRENEFMTLKTILGGSKNVLNTKENTVSFVRIESPILNDEDFGKLSSIQNKKFRSTLIDCTFQWKDEGGELEKRITGICDHVVECVNQGSNILVLDNTSISSEKNSNTLDLNNRSYTSPSRFRRTKTIHIPNHSCGRYR